MPPDATRRLAFEAPELIVFPTQHAIADWSSSAAAQPMLATLFQPVLLD